MNWVQPVLRGISLPFLLFLIMPLGVSWADDPPFFEGELGVCNAIAVERSKGKDLRSAIVSFLNGFDSNDPLLLKSVLRTVIRNAIEICGYDPVTVIQAAYLEGVALEVIVGSALDTGLPQDEIEDILVAIGVDLRKVRKEVVIAQAFLGSDIFLPDPYSVEDLGPGSPYVP